MALKKPLVLTSGQLEQLQSTDYINTNEIPQYTNNNVGAIVIGTPVYIVAAGAVDKAKSDAVGTTNVLGLVYDTSISAATSGGVLIEGVLTATTGQWDTVAGTSGGLTFNTIYYLSQTSAGQITSTAPSTAGQFVVQVGIAINTTDMKIQISPRVKL